MDFNRIFKAHGKSKAEIARAMGKTPQALEGIISNGNPKLDNLELMAKALGVTLSEFFACEEEQKDKGIAITCPHCGGRIDVEVTVK